MIDLFLMEPPFIRCCCSFVTMFFNLHDNTLAMFHQPGFGCKLGYRL
uniref:Uncharacterized protein n=1 Tax=Rhizophora mucronata TaxID=61149 RepID=A0A2P2P2F0_RHIMU